MLFPSSLSSLLLCPCPSSMPSSTNTEEEEQQQQRALNDRLHSNDPHLADMAKGIQCCFGGIPHAKEPERQQNFLQSAQMAKKLHIAIPCSGLNFHLNLGTAIMAPQQNDIHFQSDFHFNGHFIRLKGQINVRTLAGSAKIEPLQSQQRADVNHLNSEMERARRERIERRLAQLREAVLRV